MKLRLLTIVVLLVVVTIRTEAQKAGLQRIDPPFWWTGMQNNTLQLMVYGENISATKPQIHYPGVLLKEVIAVESPNYLFLNLVIDNNAKAGSFDIGFYKKKRKVESYKFVLKTRDSNPDLHKGFDNSDVIYLLMPDRFANGDSTNDNMPGMIDTAKRSNPLGRHGGDIRGIANHLDYLNELGVTTIWTTPLLENNMPRQSYHGYAITDYYNIDPRFGTNEDYKKLVKEAHQKGLKIVMDMVANHCGTGYYWNDDLPSKDWYNQWPEFTRSNYRVAVQSDPNAPQADYDKMVKGWFDHTMADLNQHNKLLAEFLIQNTIWWIEYAGIDGIRQDTYPYSYKDFMAEWMQRILEEYPDFNVVGEVWLDYPPVTAYWMDNKTNADGYRSYLTNVFDFPLSTAIARAFNEKEGWSSGTMRLYELLSQDFLYSNPMNIVTFSTNHDADRFFSKMNEDYQKFKLGMIFLMTTRGIPQIYYGGEILMTGREHKGHGTIREDFPGGWPGDSENAFTSQGRTEEQEEAFNFMRRLLNWRKNNRAVQYGSLKQYLPEDGVYVYFRHFEGESVMVVLNNIAENKTIDLSRFEKDLAGFNKGRSVLTRQSFDSLDTLNVPAKSGLVIVLGE
ncbi:MAG: glycoside hydrolase family 13 protein [Bacteroidales bacterium]|nr:glycoside hydrolase family 13 protein [Bacteroidales bacterium]